MVGRLSVSSSARVLCQRQSLGPVQWKIRVCEVMSLARICGEVVELVAAAGLEMPHELPGGGSDHSHSGDLVVVHVILTEERVVPGGEGWISHERDQALSSDFKIPGLIEPRDLEDCGQQVEV